MVAAMSASAAEKTQSPNIVFILADDLGYGDISAFNPESKISTPNIDRLARDGMMFTDAHAASALSTPSRYGMLTGRYPWRTKVKKGVLSGYSPAMITPDRHTMPQMLKEQGYATAIIGKWHLGWDWKLNEGAKDEKDVDFSAPIANGPTTRGFDYFYGTPASTGTAPCVYIENDHVTALPDRVLPNKKGLEAMHGGPAGPDYIPEQVLPNIVSRGVKYIESRKGNDQPFFLYLPIAAPHTPILPTKEYQGKTSIGPYGDFVVMIDDMVQKVTDALKRSGKLDNTIVIFAADNGCAPYIGVKEMNEAGHFPSYIYRGYKNDIYEGGHRTPLIVSWKGHLSNAKCNDLVSLTDFYATFAQMTHHSLGNDEAVDSYSIWPILCQNGKSTRKDLIYASGKGFLSLRTPELKLVFHAGSGGWGYPATPKEMEGLPKMQLFDLTKDPSEQTNIIDNPDYASHVKEMTQALRNYIAEGRTTPGQAVDNDTPPMWNQVRMIMK